MVTVLGGVCFALFFSCELTVTSAWRQETTIVRGRGGAAFGAKGETVRVKGVSGQKSETQTSVQLQKL